MDDFNYIAAAIALIAAGIAGLAVLAWALALIPATVALFATGAATYTVLATAGKIQD